MTARGCQCLTKNGCYIVSTGHGITGPFTFGGVALLDFVQAYVSDSWSQVEVVSADGFGNRVFADELIDPSGAGLILLAYEMDKRPLIRKDGLVRMIVPSERDDALRQVKWAGNDSRVGAGKKQLTVNRKRGEVAPRGGSDRNQPQLQGRPRTGAGEWHGSKLVTVCKEGITTTESETH